jgi:hypothetical protein
MDDNKQECSTIPLWFNSGSDYYNKSVKNKVRRLKCVSFDIIFAYPIPYQAQVVACVGRRVNKILSSKKFMLIQPLARAFVLEKILPRAAPLRPAAIASRGFGYQAIMRGLSSVALLQTLPRAVGQSNLCPNRGGVGVLRPMDPPRVRYQYLLPNYLHEGLCLPFQQCQLPLQPR